MKVKVQGFLCSCLTALLVASCGTSGGGARDGGAEDILVEITDVDVLHDPDSVEETIDAAGVDVAGEEDAVEAGCVENTNRLLSSLHRFAATVENTSDWMGIRFSTERCGCINSQLTGGDTTKFNVACSSGINFGLKPEYPTAAYPINARFEFVIPSVPAGGMEIISTKGDLGAVALTIENINDPLNPSTPMTFTNDQDVPADPTNRAVFNVPHDFLAAGGPVSLEAEAGPKPSFRRAVSAFYYPWYGSPDGPAGAWVHWDPANHYASTHQPELGYYDSGDPDVVLQHMNWALDAGIEVFVVSYWGRGTYEEGILPLLHEKALETGMKITTYMETAVDGADLVGQLKFLADTYGTSPSWLAIDGRPVFFIYSRLTGQFSGTQWTTIMEGLSSDGYEPFLIGDTISLEGIRLFDGIHTYNPVAQPGDAVASSYWFGSVAASFHGKIFVATVIPGYDDTIIRDPGLAVDRDGGNLYRWYWDTATEIDPDMIVVTSWNEWHEGSEIEPSAEFGHQYLDITDEKSNMFCTIP